MQKKEISKQPMLLNKLALESMSDAIFCIDKNLLCTFINPAALKMLDYTYDDCIGKNIHNLVHDKQKNNSQYPGALCPICNALINKEGCIVEDEVFWKSNENPIKVRYTSNPII